MHGWVVKEIERDKHTDTERHGLDVQLSKNYPNRFNYSVVAEQFRHNYSVVSALSPFPL